MTTTATTARTASNGPDSENEARFRSIQQVGNFNGIPIAKGLRQSVDQWADTIGEDHVRAALDVVAGKSKYSKSWETTVGVLRNWSADHRFVGRCGWQDCTADGPVELPPNVTELRANHTGHAS